MSKMNSTVWRDRGFRVFNNQKRYFKKYYHKIEYLITNSDWSVVLNLARRYRLDRLAAGIQYERRHRRYNSSRYDPMLRNYHVSFCLDHLPHVTDDIIIDLVTKMSKYYWTKEGSRLKFFAVNELELEQIHTEMMSQILPLRVSRIHIASPETVKILSTGVELVTTKVSHSHKIYFRDRKVGTQVKQQIMAYLMNPDVDAKVTPGVIAKLSSSDSRITQCWCRTNEPTIVQMLELISPGIVRSVVPVYVNS
jgi:hypothetical protein